MKTIKKVFGVGINTSDRNTTLEYRNGKRIRCPIYTQWKDMMRRCYDPKIHQKMPTYIGCTVGEEWIDFKYFIPWYEDQDPPPNYQLDKDLLIPGNKVYSPDTCILVPPHINLLLRGSQRQSQYPVGVHYRHNRYIAQCKQNYRNIYLGSYSTVEEAHHAYSQYKIKVVQQEIDQTNDPKLKQALYNWITLLQNHQYI